VEFAWEAQDGTIDHAIVDDTEYQQVAALVAGAKAAFALPLYLDERHPLFYAVLPDNGGVLRARWRPGLHGVSRPVWCIEVVPPPSAVLSHKIA
jgi:hypothetical protein